MDEKYRKIDSNLLLKKKLIEAGRPGKYLKTGSKLLHQRCARGCQEKVDRISELPNEIIISILSLLSLREVVSTSVLSSRWLDLWKHTTNLNFNNELIKVKPRMQRPMDLHKYIQIVNSVLLSHKALMLSGFKISLHVTKSAHGAVSKWIEFLFSREVKSLELDFLCRSEVDKVSLQDILSDTRLCPPQTDVILFKSLKRLRLKSCILSGEDIGMFLCNCPLLERLSIHHTLLTSDVVVSGTTLKLLHLDIYHCSGDISITLSAPELNYLRVDTESDTLLLENLPKLTGVDLTCRSRRVDDAKHFASAVFCDTSRWKFLNLTLICPTVFLLAPTPLMPNLKTLKVTYYGSYGHCLLTLTRIIWASPLLEEFKLEFRDLGRQTDYRVFSTSSSRDPHRRLKVFEFKGFCVEARQHVELVKYTSTNCDALKIITIRCRPLCFNSAAILKDSKQIAQAVAYRDRVERLLRRRVHHVKLRVLTY